MSGVIFYDSRLVGASDIIASSFSRLVVASRLQRKLITLGPNQSPASSHAHIQVTGASTEQVIEPVKLAYDTTYIYALGVDTFMRFTNAATPVVQVTTSIVCDRPNWIIVHGAYILCPYTDGGVQVLDTSGALVGLYYAGMIRASFAAFDGDQYLYVIDDTNGRGYVLKLADDGTLTLANRFSALNCRGIKGGFLDGTDLVIALQHRVVTFDVTDPEAPVFSDATGIPTANITNIVSLGDGEYWLTTEEYYSPQEARFTIGSTCGVNIPELGLFILHAKLGAVSGVSLESGPTVYAGIDRTLALAEFTTAGSTAGPGSDDLTFLWTKVSGPGTVTFDDATALITDVNMSTPGTYVLRLTGTDGAFSITDDVTIILLGTRDIVATVPAGTHYVTLAYPVSIVLEAAPTIDNAHTVVFTAASGTSIFSGGTMTFTSANWNVPQLLYVICDYPADTKTFPYTITPLISESLSGSFQMLFSDVPTPQFMPYMDVIYTFEVMDHIPNFDEAIDPAALSGLAYFDKV